MRVGRSCCSAKSWPIASIFKKQTVQQRPQLNPGAQARYDATNAGEPFEYATKTFQRLSNEQIIEICTSGRFKLSSRY